MGPAGPASHRRRGQRNVGMCLMCPEMEKHASRLAFQYSLLDLNFSLLFILIHVQQEMEFIRGSIEHTESR